MKKLFVLAVSVWDADDYFSGSNCDPMNTEFFLFKDEKEAREFAYNLSCDITVVNDTVLYSAELSDEEILELSNYDSIDEFNKALESPYVVKIGSYGEGPLVKEIIDNSTDPTNIPCSNYEYKSIAGSILVVWSWEKYVGYARKFLEVRSGYFGDTEKLLVKKDKTFVPQVDVLMTKEEVENCVNLKEEILSRLQDTCWKWVNPNSVENAVNLKY